MGGLYGKSALLVPENPLPKSDLDKGLTSMQPSTSREQFGLFASEFLYRKIHSVDTSRGAKLKVVEEYFDKCARPREADRVGLDAIDRLISDYFKEGWDSEFDRIVDKVTISRSACEERGRKWGGARAEAILDEDEPLTQSEFFRLIELGGCDIPQNRRVEVLTDNGKVRIVTIASYLQSQLLPLHILLYNHCRKLPFILVGDATPEKFVRRTALKSDLPFGERSSQWCFKGLTFKKGYDFVSGDYEGATDNFNPLHSAYLLGALKGLSRHVPRSLWDKAIEALAGTISCEIEMGKGREPERLSGIQINGQMMGNYLSFPLLCLINASTLYIAYPTEAKDMLDTVTKINGDDIVFQCRRGEHEKWFDAVERAGLVLSRGKTLVHPRFWSLNSTFFESTNRLHGHGVKLIPVLRSKAFYGPSKDPATRPEKHRVEVLEPGLIGRANAVVRGFQGQMRAFVLRQFWLTNLPQVLNLTWSRTGALLKSDALNGRKTRVVREMAKSFIYQKSLWKGRSIVPPAPDDYIVSVNQGKVELHESSQGRTRLFCEVDGPDIVACLETASDTRAQMDRYRREFQRDYRWEKVERLKTPDVLSWGSWLSVSARDQAFAGWNDLREADVVGLSYPMKRVLPWVARYEIVPKTVVTESSCFCELCSRVGLRSRGLRMRPVSHGPEPCGLKQLYERLDRLPQTNGRVAGVDHVFPINPLTIRSGWRKRGESTFILCRDLGGKPLMAEDTPTPIFVRDIIFEEPKFTPKTISSDLEKLEEMEASDAALRKVAQPA